MSAKPASQQAVCLDCGEGLLGNFCHECGQSSHIHRTLGAWGHDFTHGVLHIEGAVWRTIRMLFRHPGELTRRYIDGQRRRYLSPLALYLFSVFLLYVTYSLLGGVAEVNAPNLENSSAAIQAEAQQAQAATQMAEQQRTVAAAQGRDTKVLDRHIQRLTRAEAELANAQIILENKSGHRKTAITLTGWQPLDTKVERAIHDPELLMFKMEANGYKFAWALIPLSLPFMWLLFAWRSDVRMFDHAVFVTYSMSFVSFLVSIMLIWSNLFGIGGSGILLLLYPVHLFAQLRGGYKLSPASAAICSALVLAISIVVLTIWIVLLLLFGIVH